MIVNKYKVWCSTDNVWKYIWSEAAPTLCPDGHPIDASKTAIVERTSTSQVVLADAEKASDGRLVASIATFEKGLQTYYTSADDDVSAGTRGNGGQFILSQAGAGIAIRDGIQFIDEVFIVGGRMWINGGFLEDHVDFEAHAPATPVLVNGTTTGNCTLLDLGGGANMIVPSNGVGTHDVDLTKALNVNLAAKSVGYPTLVTEAVPVPASLDGMGVPTGLWDYDRKTGTISAASVTGQGFYNLMNFPLTLMRWVNRLSIWSPDGNADRSLDVPIRDSLVLPQWILKVTMTCNNIDAGIREGSWKFNMGRKVTT